MGFLFTSEAVTGGHPDKLAATISDSIATMAAGSASRRSTVCPPWKKADSP